MKKIICLFLMFSVIMSSFSTTYAKSDNQKKEKEVIKLDKMEKKDAEALLAEYGIILPNEENEELYDDITYGDLIIEYIDIDSANTSDLSDENLSVIANSSQSSLAGGQIRLAKVEKQYNGDWEQINNSSAGMAYWLDVVWNLSIGSTTKHFWKAATILNLNPSNFKINYNNGDYLARSYQKIYYYNCAQVCPGSTWTTLVSSQKIASYVHLNLRTTNGAGASVVKNGYGYQGFYADHYFDEDYLVARARELYEMYGLLVIENYYVD